MLERPNPAAIAGHLRAAYGLTVIAAEPLTDGADSQAAGYRVDTANGRYFLKLCRGTIDATGAELVRFLAESVPAVIAPLTASDGELVTGFADWTALLYPFFDGRNGFAVPPTEEQWEALGRAVRAIHELEPPAGLSAAVPVETFGPSDRDRARRHLARGEDRRQPDAAAGELLRLLLANRERIRAIIARAERLADVLRNGNLPLVFCHGDLHAGNVLLAADGSLAIVDWDDPVLAPRERDLMFIGGGVGGAWGTESVAFYRGYGEVQVNQWAIAYYRYERIVADIAEYCDYLLLGGTGGAADRARNLRFFADQFRPRNVVELADETYDRLALS